MENLAKTKQYWAKLLPAVIWHALYLTFCGSFGKYTRAYFDLAYYLGIAIYFYIWREWSFSQWHKALKNGKKFWVPVLLTALGMAGMFGVGVRAAMLFPGADDGMGVFGVDSWANLAAFAITTIILPPIAEEPFSRKAVTAFDSKAVLAASVTASIFLYASEHSLMPLGFFQACLWAVPLSVAYVRTRNIYVCMTAHFICNFAMNGIGVAGNAVRLFQMA